LCYDFVNHPWWGNICLQLADTFTMLLYTMKTRTLSCCFILLCFCAEIAFAQSGGLKGKVSAEGGKPIVFASVLLLKTADSAVLKTALTDEKGAYTFTGLQSDAFFVKVLFTGYETYRTQSLSVSDTIFSMPEIVLVQNSTLLKEVAVQAQKPFIEVHPDKLVVNVDNSIVSAGSTALEVLARAPGVTVDQNDNISLKGRQGVNVMIDGKLQPLSAEELANMLKSMPSNSIDKIEIISNPSAKYDAAGTAGIIDIKTKKGQRQGLNGTANASYGQGIYNKANLGFNLNYKRGKINLYAGYNYYYKEALNDVVFLRHFYDSTGIYSGAYNQHNYTTYPTRSHLPVAGIEYDISANTSVGVSVKGQAYSRDTKGFYFSKVLDPNNVEQSYFTTTARSAGQWNNYTPNLHVKHKLDTAGKEISADVDYGRYWNKNNQDFITNYYLTNGALTQAPYLLHGDISGITQIRSVKADYSNPMKNNVELDAGIKSSYVTADNQPNFFDRSNGGNVFDAGKSDHFIYTENINAAYINASKEGKKWSTQLGLRAEQTDITGKEEITMQAFKKNYLQLFPSLALQRHLDAKNDISLNLNRRIERPNYQQLNSYKFYVDPSTYKQGNPYLDPCLTYGADFTYTYKQRFITTINYAISNSPITEVVEPSPTQSRVAIQTEVNLTRMTYYGLSGSYSFPIYKWWNEVVNFDATYTRYQDNLANTALDKSLPFFDVYVNSSFLLPKNWSAEMVFFYQSAQLNGFLTVNENWTLNIGIQKALLDKVLIVRLNAADIFYTGTSGGSSSFTDYNLSFAAKHDTRQVTLSLSYRFGNKTAQPALRHKSGADEEETRASAT